MEIKRHIQTSVENKARQTFCCYWLLTSSWSHLIRMLVKCCLTFIQRIYL